MRHVKLLYFMGVYANPSARCWQEADKRALGRFLQELPWSLPVIEDMAYRELYFRTPWPARSILSLTEWESLPHPLYRHLHQALCHGSQSRFCREPGP